MPPVAVTGLELSAIKRGRNGDGSSRRLCSFSRVTEKTSNGPQKSRTSTSSYTKIPTRFLCMRASVLRGSTAEGLTFEHPRAEASEASCSTLGETDAPTEYQASTRESTVVEEKSRVNPHEQNGTRNRCAA